MSTLRIALAEDRSAFRPGEEIAGTVSWQFPERPPRDVEVRLCWFTRGSGNRDSDVVAKVPLDTPQAMESRPFRFIAPAEPHSFSGELMSLVWCVEAVANPGDVFERTEIVIGPNAREIVLRKVDDTAPLAPLPMPSARHGDR